MFVFPLKSEFFKKTSGKIGTLCHVKTVYLGCNTRASHVHLFLAVLLLVDLLHESVFFSPFFCIYVEFVIACLCLLRFFTWLFVAFGCLFVAIFRLPCLFVCL